MIDSSYVQASDPNTMRTFGPNRNAIYNFNTTKPIKDESEQGKSKR